MIVFEYNFGEETYGKICQENGGFQCYVTPLYGGEFLKEGNLFKTLEEAKKFLMSLT